MHATMPKTLSSFPASRTFPGVWTDWSISLLRPTSRAMAGLSVLNACHRMIKDCVGVGVRQWPSSHLQTVIDGCVKEVNDGIGISFRAKVAFFDSFLKISNRHSAPRHGPSFAQRDGQLGIELSGSKQRTDQRTVFSSKGLGHCAHLHTDRIQVVPARNKKSIWIDPGYERVHHYRGLVRPAAIERHAPDTSLFGDGIRTECPKAVSQHKVGGGLQNSPLNFRASRPAALRRRLFLSIFLRSHSL